MCTRTNGWTFGFVAWFIWKRIALKHHVQLLRCVVVHITRTSIKFV
jgi:hypothetical protein